MLLPLFLHLSPLGFLVSVVCGPAFFLLGRSGLLLLLASRSSLSSLLVDSVGRLGVPWGFLASSWLGCGSPGSPPLSGRAWPSPPGWLFPVWLLFCLLFFLARLASFPSCRSSFLPYFFFLFTLLLPLLLGLFLGRADFLRLARWLERHLRSVLCGIRGFLDFFGWLWVFRSASAWCGGCVCVVCG